MRQRSQKLMRILLVGKDAVQNEWLGSIFLNSTSKSEPVYQFEIIKSMGADDAMDLYSQKHPDLILVSSDLKGRDCGKELCKKIRQQETERHTGIIFISTNSNEEKDLAIECLELGADDYLYAESNEREILVRVQSVLKIKSMTDELRSANHRLQLLSHTDDLTGLHNMRSFNQHFLEMLKNCRSGTCALGVIMLDLDHFKLVNDNNNHLVGSFLLSEVGKLLRLSGIFDKKDCIARYGGDEFIIAVPSKNIDEVVVKAEQLRKIVFNSEFKRESKTIKITTSIGVAWIDLGYKGKDEDPIKAADMMLYKSKKDGRNRITSMVFDESIDLEPISKNYLKTNMESDDSSVEVPKKPKLKSS